MMTFSNRIRWPRRRKGSNKSGEVTSESCRFHSHLPSTLEKEFMKWFFVALLITASACRTITPDSQWQADMDTELNIPDDSILIVGVRIPGIYRIPAEGTSVDDA